MSAANSDMAKLADKYERKAVFLDNTFIDEQDIALAKEYRVIAAALRQSPSPAEQDGREAIAHRILIDAMGWHPSENGPSYTKTKDDLTDRLRDLLRSPSGTPAPGGE